MKNQGNESRNERRLKYLIAGGTAGMVARTCVAPVERIKIIYQVKKGKANYLDIAPQIFRSQGPLAFWKGNGAAVVRVIPFMSITFTVYEETKQYLTPYNFSDNSTNVLSGSVAGFFGVACTYPLDVVRARLALQLEGMVQTSYTGVSDALVSIARQEGVLALYKGMGTTLIGAVPYQGLKFGAYEVMKKFLRSALDVEEEDLSATMRVGSGAFAGLCAQTLVYPFDVIRRRNQAHTGKGSRYKSPVDGFRTIAREEGIKKGLYRGLTLNFLKSIPNVAIYMSLFDYIKMKMF